MATAQPSHQGHVQAEDDQGVDSEAQDQGPGGEVVELGEHGRGLAAMVGLIEAKGNRVERNMARFREPAVSPSLFSSRRIHVIARCSGLVQA
jgi:hypothetical protein